MNEEYIDYNKLPEELRNSPYEYIKEYYESIYPFIGAKVFSILALVPVSLIIPKIPRGKTQVKAHISFLLLSPPGSAKSSLAEQFEKITYDPIPMEDISDARLYYELEDKERVSLVVSDIARIFGDFVLTKQLENVLGEEGCISRSTMKNKHEDTKRKIQAVAYLSGTPANIANKTIRDGILARTCPLIVYYDEKEHNQIIDYVNEQMGVEENGGMEDFIPSFYEELRKIQDNEHDFIHPIEGYIISEEIKEKVKEFIKKLIQPYFKNYGITSVREVEETYRFMISHCFLNIHSRKVQEGKLIIEEEDMKVAKKLIKREIIMKNLIMGSIIELDSQNIRTNEQLRNFVTRYESKNKRELPKEAKFVMSGFVKK